MTFHPQTVFVFVILVYEFLVSAVFDKVPQKLKDNLIFVLLFIIAHFIAVYMIIDTIQTSDASVLLGLVIWFVYHMVMEHVSRYYIITMEKIFSPHVVFLLVILGYAVRAFILWHICGIFI